MPNDKVEAKPTISLDNTNKTVVQGTLTTKEQQCQKKK